MTSLHRLIHWAVALAVVAAVFTLRPAVAAAEAPPVVGCCNCGDNLVFNPHALGSQTSPGRGGAAAVGACNTDPATCGPPDCGPFIPGGVCVVAGDVCLVATPTATPTPTPTPTATPTATPTPTPTPTPHNLQDTDPCNDSRQCASALCNGGVCAERNPAPAVSNHTAVFIGTALLLAGLWSVRRVTARR